MSANDPRLPPRRKKLVLRKIAGVEGATSIPEGWSNSYTGPLPVVRPPPRLSSPDGAFDGADDADPEIISEMVIEATVVVTPSPDAFAAAAMTSILPPSMGSMLGPVIADPMTARRASFHALPVSPPAESSHYAPPARPSDGGSRITVAPVVSTLSSTAAVARASLFGRSRLSLDSKVLAAGGALAAAMLLVALGFILGGHTNRSTPSSAAALSVEPMGIEAKATGSMPAAPPAAVNVPPAAPALVDGKGARLDGHDVVAAVDVSQLPAVSTSRGRWIAVPTGPRASEANGWTIANSPSRGAGLLAPSKGAGAAETKRVDPETPAAVRTPQIPAAALAPVDPLVQAVREDIREDEARTK